MNRLSFVPFIGCMIGNKYPQIEAAARLSLDKLGIELVDVDGFTCCPDPIFFKARSKVDWLTVAGRNLCLAEEAGHDIVTLCTGCASTLGEANHTLRHDAALRERVNERLAAADRQFRGTISVRHIVTVLRDEVGIEAIRASVTRPLDGLKVAIHYGCHLLKPSEVMACDDPDRPTIIEDLLRALGATPMHRELELLCCGRSCMTPEIPEQMMLDHLRSIVAAGADCLTLVCPTCFDQFDLGQIKASRASDEKFAVPVLYALQLLGIAQGFSEEQMGLQFHRNKIGGLLAVPA